MNKKSWMVLRIVAGLYLVFLGVQIISQVTREQPNNLALMICAAVLFIGVGVVYAGAAISSVWKMSRGGEKSQEDDLQIVEKEDSMETSQETRREIPDIQFKQEMPEQEEKEEKEVFQDWDKTASETVEVSKEADDAEEAPTEAEEETPADDESEAEAEEETEAEETKTEE